MGRHRLIIRQRRNKRDVDLGIFRYISLERGIVFQLRGEATNLFNLVSLGTPGLSGVANTVAEPTPVPP